MTVAALRSQTLHSVPTTCRHPVCCRAVATVIVTLAVSILGAYAVARLQFFGKRTVHFLFLSVYLFPSILLAIPLFVAFSKLKLRGELWVLVIVYVAQTLPVVNDGDLTARVRAVHAQLFPDEDSRPARHALNVPLNRNMLVQLEVVAVAPQ